MTWAVIVLGMGGLTALAYIVLRAAMGGEAAKERVAAEEEELAKAKQQGEEIAAEKDPEDVAKDLDSGKF